MLERSGQMALIRPPALIFVWVFMIFVLRTLCSIRTGEALAVDRLSVDLHAVSRLCMATVPLVRCC